MSYMNLICIYCLVCFVIIHPTLAAPVTFQIDEFIKQLMSSDKFDKLTDLIADKAAQKIKDIDSKTSHASSLVLRERVEDNDDDHKSTEKIIFDLKPPQRKDSKLDNIQSKHDKHDKKSKKHKAGTKENNNRSDERKENSHEKYKESSETNDSHANENRRLKSKNDRVEKKRTSREKDRSSSEANKNNKTRSREDKHKSLRTRENTSGSKKTEIHKNKEIKITNISKIDTQALLKSHINSKELELNFKHLKGEVQKRNSKESKPNKIDTDKRKSSHEDNIKETSNREGKDEDDINSKDKRKNKTLQESSNENKKHEQSSFHSTENKEHSQQRPRINDSQDEMSENEDNDENNSRNIKTHKSADSPIARIGKSRNESEEVNKTDEEEMNNAKIFIDKVMDRVSKELKNPTFSPKEVGKDTKEHASSSKEVVEIGLNNNKHSGESEINNSDSKEKTDPKNDTSQRKIFRVEDGKQFTYQSSAEYAEYHENLANAPKPKYFNTY